MKVHFSAPPFVNGFITMIQPSAMSLDSSCVLSFWTKRDHKMAVESRQYAQWQCASFVSLVNELKRISSLQCGTPSFWVINPSHENTQLGWMSQIMNLCTYIHSNTCTHTHAHKPSAALWVTSDWIIHVMLLVLVSKGMEVGESRPATACSLFVPVCLSVCLSVCVCGCVPVYLCLYVFHLLSLQPSALCQSAGLCMSNKALIINHHDSF